MPKEGDGGAPSLPPEGSGRYRNLLRLGRGGMGTVDLAVEQNDDETPGRVVALKRLLPEVCDARHADMFLREARLGALLRHKNVVQALDFGEIDGEPFLAMEYVEGQTLADVLAALKERGRGLPVPLLAHVLREVCAGLHAAHELKDVSGKSLGVVHRDVSPHNIVISYTGDVKVLDFGVAKIDRDSTTTRTGEVKGKMAYMSPEQALGDPLDRRSDFFALGAVLFECVAGARMWGDGTDMEILRRFALGAPPKLASVAEDLPAPLLALHERLTAVPRAERPNSAADIAAELGRLASETAKQELSSLMTELFEDRAREQRAALEAALKAKLPQQEAERLRESLVPALSVPPVSASAAVSAPKNGARGLVALGVVGAVLAMGAAVAVARGKGTDGAPGKQAPVSTASGTVAATTTATATPEPRSSASAVGPTAATSALPAPRPKVPVTPLMGAPVATQPKAQSPAASAVAKPAESGHKLHVDPEPF